MSRALIATAVGGLLLPALALAQDAPDTPLGPGTRSGEPRLLAGAALSVAQPVHEFRAFVKNGVGVTGHGLARLGGAGAFAIRIDGGFLNYGRETKQIPWSDRAGRVTVDLTTNNNIFWAGIGPQLMVPSGPVRPYVNGTAGFTVFTTTSSIRDRQTDTDIVSDRNQSDAAFSYGGGGGFLIPLSVRARSAVFLDLGARFHRNGQLTYLREGGITDLPGGNVRYDRIRSEANLWTYHLGVSVGGR